MRLKNAKKAPIKTINTNVMWNNLSDVKVERACKRQPIGNEILRYAIGG
ncbi:hypothetical protein CCAN11_2380009 [Capnocytophaga canimorsus]|uniref:Uncharacterized protein n=1 Tax=Capnocytophaga canimorsus TaxID=28188 RepID=A0A0B7IJ99_9FLAO|nr:hypothetical protein CCAN11_2380009 [Capnocytophaga canimorsus]